MTGPSSLHIVGVGHVFRIEDQVRSLVNQQRPAAVAVELDEERYHGLMLADPEAGPPPGSPRAYRDLARFQQDVAKHHGGRVGDELRAAVHAAREADAKLLLIDEPAEQMMRRALAQMRFRERVRFFWETFRTRFGPMNSKKLQRDIQRLTDDPEPMIRQLGRKYPTLHRVLIEERNHHMAQRLRRAVEEHGNVMAFVGDGHVAGLSELLSDLEPQLTRLRELRRAADRPGVGFSFTAPSLGRDFYEPPT